MEETLNCYILDDQSIATDLIKGYVNRTPGLSLTGSSDDPTTAIEEIQGMEGKLHILFTDINLPGMNGFEVSALVGGILHTVFITAYENYAVRSYEHGAVDYLLKPVAYERFLIAVARVRERIAGRSGLAVSHQGLIILPGERKNKIFRVKKDDIICAEAKDGKVKLYMVSGNRTAYLSLKQFAEVTNNTSLVQVHRSFIVNLDRIQEVDTNLIVMEQGLKITISRDFKAKFQELFLQGAINFHKP